MLHRSLLVLFLAFSSLHAGNPPPQSAPMESDYDEEEDEDEDVLLLEEDVDEENEPHN